MPYRVTVRAPGRVERSDHTDLDDALIAVAAAARTAAAGPKAREIDLRARRWAPEDQVRTRVEVKGPERWRASTHAGVDVLGDGSLQPWTGAPERRVVEPEQGEDPIAALRRVITA